jgi:hypothetical protein
MLLRNHDLFSQVCTLVDPSGVVYDTDARGLPLAGLFCDVAKSPDLGIDADAVVGRLSCTFPDSILPVAVRASALGYFQVIKDGQKYLAERVYPDETMQVVILSLVKLDDADTED